MNEILNLIEITQNLERNYFWIQEESILHLPKIQYSFVLIMDWLNWEAWEGDLIIDKRFADGFRTFNVEWFASLFDKVTERAEDLYSKDKQLWEDELYRYFNQTFLKRKEELIGNIYDFVKENLNKFP